MKKVFALLAIFALVASTPALAYFLPDGEKSVEVDTVANLTACSASLKGKMAVVTDGATATDCTTGSGSSVNVCVCDGTNYADVT